MKPPAPPRPVSPELGVPERGAAAVRMSSTTARILIVNVSTIALLILEADLLTGGIRAALIGSTAAVALSIARFLALKRGV